MSKNKLKEFVQETGYRVKKIWKKKLSDFLVYYEKNGAGYNLTSLFNNTGEGIHQGGLDQLVNLYGTRPTVGTRKSKVIKQAVSKVKGTKVGTVYDIVIMDRSGSMSSIKNVVQTGIDEYINGLVDTSAKVKVKTLFTLLDFDSSDKIKFHHTNVVPTKDLKYDLKPRGDTALLDAIGDAINKVDSFNPTKNDSVTITIFTDGEENASGRFNQEQINQMVTDRTSKGWTFAFMGGGNKEQVFKAAKAYGFSATNTMSYNPHDKQSVKMSAKKMSSSRSLKTSAFAAGKSTNVNYFVEDKN